MLMLDKVHLIFWKQKLQIQYVIIAKKTHLELNVALSFPLITNPCKPNLLYLSHVSM